MEEMNEAKPQDEMIDAQPQKGWSIGKILLAALGGLILLGCAGFVFYILVAYAGKFG